MDAQVPEERPPPLTRIVVFTPSFEGVEGLEEDVVFLRIQEHVLDTLRKCGLREPRVVKNEAKSFELCVSGTEEDLICFEQRVSRDINFYREQCKGGEHGCLQCS